MEEAKPTATDSTQEILPEGDRLPEVGETVISKKDAFVLVCNIGKGGYGSVFRVTCKNSERPLALKAELYSKAVLRNELIVMKTAAQNNCKHICRLTDYGRVGRQFKYLVMTLLGHDLYKLRKERVSQHFSLGTAVRAAKQALESLEDLHSCGFVSRDVKPSNFATGNPNDKLLRLIFILDFGLSKRYMKDSVLLPSRGSVGWRGTLRYASLNAHSRLDQCRKDDVESWLYMSAEFSNGSLPWRFFHDRAEVRVLKECVRRDASSRAALFVECPPQYEGFLAVVDLLGFDSAPPYQQFHGTLDEILRVKSVAADAPYDWEAAEEEPTSSFSEGGITTPLLTSDQGNLI